MFADFFADVIADVIGFYDRIGSVFGLVVFVTVFEECAHMCKVDEVGEEDKDDDEDKDDKDDEEDKDDEDSKHKK